MSIQKQRVLAVVATDATYERRTLHDRPVWVGKCISCNRALTVDADGTPVSRATLEHIWPRNHGGTDEIANLALACAGCNHEKGVRHDHKRQDDPKLAEVSGLLADRRRARWREPDEVGLGDHVRRLEAAEAVSQRSRSRRGGKKSRSS